MNNAHPKKLYLLDTNVLIHDPSALFHFQRHDVYIAMAVLEELDNEKKGHSEIARNVLQASRFIDEIIETEMIEHLEQGLPLPDGGRLFFQNQRLDPKNVPNPLLANLSPKKTTNQLLQLATQLQQQEPTRQIIIVSKDVSVRIKAHVLGISAEDYHSDKVLDDVDLLHTGMHALAPNATISAAGELAEVDTSALEDCYPNMGVFRTDFEGLIDKVEGEKSTIRPALDYRKQETVWGINARNQGQNFALNLLLDPKVDFVTLLGTAGTGKTLLALAAGLSQALDQDRYEEIIVTRLTVPVGDDIGFLPGTEEEKMTPWMGALMDNIEVLQPQQADNAWGKAVTADLLQNKIKVRSLNFMRGRTFLRRYIILDESQNLTVKQMKTLITRAGPGSKIVCLGNVGQIDTPYLTATTSGLTYVVDRFKQWQHAGHITLQQGERSRLAEFASENL